MASVAFVVCLGLLGLACRASHPPAELASPAGGPVPRESSEAGSAAPQPATRRFEFEEPKLGTLFRIVMYAEDALVARRAASAAFQRVDDLDVILSDYRSDSELHELSAASADGACEVSVSEDLFAVLTFSAQLAEQTDGAFDITVGPFVRLWRRSRRQGELPDRARLDQAAASVGHEKLVLDEVAHSAKLMVAGMRLDLGGVAKGYILDQAMSVLEQHGIHRALLDGGGDLLAGDAPPNQDAWIVAIESETPDRSGSTEPAPTAFRLVNAALATSGDSFQFLEVDGMRYSHIIDPRTGVGVTGTRHVTVHAQSAMRADAWASALCVMNILEGRKRVLATQGVRARWTFAGETFASEGFGAHAIE